MTSESIAQNEFQDAWRSAITMLDNNDVRLFGSTRGGRLSQLCKEQKIAPQRISEWREGKINSLMSGKGAVYVSYIAAEVAKLEPRRSSSLLATYVNYLAHLGDSIFESAIATIHERIPRYSRQNLPIEPKTSLEWISVALKVHLLVLSGDPVKAFDEAWKYWYVSREGYNIPSEAFYSFRKAAFAAKSKLVERGEINASVANLNDHLKLDSEPPNFSKYEKVAPVSRDFEMHGDIQGFTLQEFGAKNRKQLFSSIAVNTQLLDGKAHTVQLLENRQPYVIPSSCHLFAWLAFADAISAKESDLFNGYKVRPMNILSMKSFQNCVLEFQQTDYLSTLVTNRSCHLRFKEVASNDDVFLSDANGSLLDSSQMSSQIGVMVCALTADGYLVSMYQEKTNAVSGGELVPFGGSVEYHDLELLPNKTLGAIVEHTVRREIKEEAVVAFESVKDILIVGYTLDTGKGLKPDFFGLAILSEDWNDIKSNREEFYGGPFEESILDFSSVAGLRQSISVTRQKWNQLESAAFLDANLKFLEDSAEAIFDKFKNHK